MFCVDVGGLGGARLSARSSAKQHQRPSWVDSSQHLINITCQLATRRTADACPGDDVDTFCTSGLSLCMSVISTQNCDIYTVCAATTHKVASCSFSRLMSIFSPIDRDRLQLPVFFCRALLFFLLPSWARFWWTPNITHHFQWRKLETRKGDCWLLMTVSCLLFFCCLMTIDKSLMRSLRLFVDSLKIGSQLPIPRRLNWWQKWRMNENEKFSLLRTHKTKNYFSVFFSFIIITITIGHFARETRRVSCFFIRHITQYRYSHSHPERTRVHTWDSNSFRGCCRWTEFDRTADAHSPHLS